MAYQGSTEAGTAVADAIFGNQSQRQIVGDLAIRRGRPGWRLPDRRSVAAWRWAEVLRPVARHQLGTGIRLQPALCLRVRALLHREPIASRLAAWCRTSPWA